jgi:hypothetical protein
VEFVGTNEKDLGKMREDDVEDDVTLVDQDTFLQARVVAGGARLSPMVMGSNPSRRGRPQRMWWRWGMPTTKHNACKVWSS